MRAMRKLSKFAANIVDNNFTCRTISHEKSFSNPEKVVHPYRKIHPWKSVDAFSEHLANSVIYNKGNCYEKVEELKKQAILDEKLSINF